MKAIRIHQFGGPDVLELEEIVVPQPKADEVLIKVYASSVNPVDGKIVAGEAQAKFPTKFPLTIGWDVSGVIEQAGSHVRNFSIGDEVYGRPFPTQNGAFAEYLVIKASEIALKPQSIDHILAAAVPLAGLTAWQGLFKFGKLEKDQKVLIHGASGGVGSFAVQFAKWKGAEVIGTASADNLAFIKQLGADQAIDHDNQRFEEEVKDVDLVLDLIGKETQQRSLTVIKPGGILVTTVAPEYQEEAKEKHIRLEGFTAQSYARDLEEIAELIDQGLISPVVSAVFNLEEARKAEELSKQHHTRGKIVIKVI
ncbi:NADP-dependent oxidoreductase [Mucilaginibacter aquariorum]|uniref:NADP-dependent oxidoreductase n=1 Tax=Mucilaginibacter aquariorum TaxID=2967225 RepID=A0ABT1T5S6_9SPHI|nr:NADP-dependent oxidoreductase [Mucilaginibacter aquariorum]MCQ6959288.1 NADP-dependent oxidoreductase [Mucilaginibacter aquariorum]